VTTTDLDPNVLDRDRSRFVKTVFLATHTFAETRKEFYGYGHTRACAVGAPFAYRRANSLSLAVF